MSKGKMLPARLRSSAHLFSCSFGQTADAIRCSSFHLLIFGTAIMAFMFKNLDVYQKAIDLTEQIVTLTESFPRGYYFLADQLNRASLSVATNLAEGNGRYTKSDRRNFFIIARASAQECVPLLELARRKQLVQEEPHRQFRDQIEVIAKMISGLIAGIENRRA